MTDRAVFDCMVYLQAATNEDGPAFACLRQVDEGKVRLYVSVPVLAEVTDVLTRSSVRRKFPNLTPERVQTFLASVRNRSVMIDEIPAVFRYTRDPDDEPYVNLAIA